MKGIPIFLSNTFNTFYSDNGSIPPDIFSCISIVLYNGGAKQNGHN
jgi:hypothetical protein